VCIGLWAYRNTKLAHSWHFQTIFGRSKGLNGIFKIVRISCLTQAERAWTAEAGAVRASTVHDFSATTSDHFQMTINDKYGSCPNWRLRAQGHGCRTLGVRCLWKTRSEVLGRSVGEEVRFSGFLARSLRGREEEAGAKSAEQNLGWTIGGRIRGLPRHHQGDGYRPSFGIAPTSPFGP